MVPVLLELLPEQIGFVDSELLGAEEPRGGLLDLSRSAGPSEKGSYSGLGEGVP